MLTPLESPWLESGETLLCFGDSLTAADPGYVSELTARLEPQGIRVVNSGRGGDKTTWGLTRWERDVIDRKPDAVSIFLGANDAAVGRGIWADEPRVEPAAYKCNLLWMVHLARLLGGIRKFSIATPLWRFEGGTYDMHGDILLPYRQMAREAADEARTLLVPLDTAFEHETARAEARRDPATGYLFTKDGTHPTPEGYRLIARTLLRHWRLD